MLQLLMQLTMEITMRESIEIIYICTVYKWFGERLKVGSKKDNDNNRHRHRFLPTQKIKTGIPNRLKGYISI